MGEDCVRTKRIYLAKSIGKNVKSPSSGYDYSLCNGLTHHRATLMQIYTIKG